MTTAPLGLLAVFVYLAAVVLSIPAAGGVLLLSRRLGVLRAADVVGLAGVGVVAVVGLAVAVLVTPVAGLLLAGLGFVALVLLWAVPVFVGAYVVERIEGTTGEVALGYAVAALPLALLASAALFVAPGGLARYNVTFLSGPAVGVAVLGFGVLVLLGPALLGIGLNRLVARRR